MPLAALLVLTELRYQAFLILPTALSCAPLTSRTPLQRIARSARMSWSAPPPIRGEDYILAEMVPRHLCQK